MRLLADRGEPATVERGAGLRAGADRRPPRHAEPRPQEPAPGRGGAGQGVLGRRARGDGRAGTCARSSRRCTSSPARSSCAPPVPARWRASTSTASGTCSCGTSATGRSRAPPAPPATGRPPPGSRGRRASGRKTWPTCSPTTTRPRSSSTAPPGSASSQRSCEAQALRYLALAGERALSLDVDQAERQLARRSRARPGRPPRARFAAGALGAGSPAAGPAAGGEAGPRGGPRSQSRPERHCAPRAAS